jgi:hypothetical protein
MNGRVRLFAGSAALGIAAACAHQVGYTPTNPPPRPLSPRAAAEVTVFSAGARLPPSVEVGVFEAEQRGKHATSALVEALRERAGSVGCDGLLLIGSDERLVGGDSSKKVLRSYRGACLVFLAGARPAPSAPPPPVATAASRVCSPGATQACIGPGGCRGGQPCADSGLRWEVCDCGESRQDAPDAAAATPR